MGIEVTTHRHPPVATVEEARSVRGGLPGAHTKNLFLRDKKGGQWLVVALHDRAVDLLALAPKLSARGRLSFGSPERLMRSLAVRPGAVSPFGAINDLDRTVTVVLDRGLAAYEVWNAHPLKNTMTTAIRADDMLRFLNETGHPPVWVDL
jgi:Ala-tRNA(Pro) deacylase